MATGRHNLTRRALLGAAVGVPVMSSGTGTAAARQRLSWERALAEFRQAEQCFAGLGAGAMDEQLADLECRRLDALQRLLRVPAPDLRALSLKVDLTVDEEVATLAGGEPCLAMLKADARRLACCG